MYGSPTETAQDTIDALERVRQLFAAGCIQSAYWHRFAATAHSPIGLHPEEYGITLRPPRNVTFARNDIEFDDPVGTEIGRASCRERVEIAGGAGTGQKKDTSTGRKGAYRP